MTPTNPSALNPSRFKNLRIYVIGNMRPATGQKMHPSSRQTDSLDELTFSRHLGLSPPVIRTPTLASRHRSHSLRRSRELEGHRLWGHTGGMGTYWSAPALYPNKDLTIAVLVTTNGAKEDPLTIAGAVARVVLSLGEPGALDLPLSLGEVDILALQARVGL